MSRAGAEPSDAADNTSLTPSRAPPPPASSPPSSGYSDSPPAAEDATSRRAPRTPPPPTSRASSGYSDSPPSDRSHPHIDETRGPLAQAFDPMGFDVGAGEEGLCGELPASPSVATASPSVAVRGSPSSVSPPTSPRSPAALSAATASPSAAAASPSSASVSSNDSAATTVRYKKLGYDKKTLRQLPTPPARHPTSGQINRYDVDEAVDPNKEYKVRRLLHRRGKPLKLAYLVEWEEGRCVLSWMWEKNLPSLPGLMDHVDKWKAERASGITRDATIIKWGKKNRVASASPTGRCFFESLQAALFALDLQGKLPSSTWGAFTMKHQRNMDNGVKTSEMAAFFNFLRAVKAPIDVTVLRPNLLTKSTHTVERLELYARGLAPGWYIVHAGQHDDEHCFALGAFGPFVHPCIIGKYDECADPPCYMESIHNLKWITRTMSIRRVEVFVPRKKARTQ